MFRAFRRRVLLPCCAMLCVAAAAHADALADVQTLFRSGDIATALRRADTAIGTNPRDAQMRFLKGVMLAQVQRSDEAQTVFERLTEDFPELPEPYNNLAVLYGARGDWHKARQALEAALRSDPAYATARQNLGDVHLQLALQAYEQARTDDRSRDPVLERKLTLVRELLIAQALDAASLRPASP